MKIQKIVVPHDFSEYGQAALEAAVDLARSFGAELHLVHVIHTPAYGYGTDIVTTHPQLLESSRAAVQQKLEEIAESVDSSPLKVEVHVIDGGPIASAIDAFAEEIEADLIVMGTHGRTGLAHALIGSVAERTLRRAPCPVLTLRAKPHDPSAGARSREGIAAYAI